MNKKQHTHSLKKTIQQLPTFEPPVCVWTAIDRELVLQKGIQALPFHSPPEVVWKGIASSLPIPNLFFFWLKRISIAAAVIFLIGMSWLGVYNSTNVAQLTYSEELINTTIFIEDWNEETAIITQIKTYCQTQKHACISPEFQTLQNELVELEEAKSDLTQAIADYGKDTDLIIQLTEIEMERTTVLKKMIEKML